MVFQALADLLGLTSEGDTDVPFAGNTFLGATPLFGQGFFKNTLPTFATTAQGRLAEAVALGADVGEFRITDKEFRQLPAGTNVVTIGRIAGGSEKDRRTREKINDIKARLDKAKSEDQRAKLRDELETLRGRRRRRFAAPDEARLAELREQHAEKVLGELNTLRDSPEFREASVDLNRAFGSLSEQVLSGTALSGFLQDPNAVASALAPVALAKEQADFGNLLSFAGLSNLTTPPQNAGQLAGLSLLTAQNQLQADIASQAAKQGAFSQSAQMGFAQNLFNAQTGQALFNALISGGKKPTPSSGATFSGQGGSTFGGIF